MAIRDKLASAWDMIALFAITCAMVWAMGTVCGCGAERIIGIEPVARESDIRDVQQGLIALRADVEATVAAQIENVADTVNQTVNEATGDLATWFLGIIAGGGTLGGIGTIAGIAVWMVARRARREAEDAKTTAESAYTTGRKKRREAEGIAE